MTRVRFTERFACLAQWILRDELSLTRTKYRCGSAQCGACTVYLYGLPVRACQVPARQLGGKEITTIEGLENPAHRHAVQEARIEHQVAQCGYCQSGKIMQAAGLIQKNNNPSADYIDWVMSGNLCRCGTYPRIRDAIKTGAKNIQEESYLWVPLKPLHAVRF